MRRSLAIAGAIMATSIALTDVIMPKLSGAGLASRLRLRYPGIESDLHVWLHESALGAGRNCWNVTRVMLQKETFT